MGFDNMKTRLSIFLSVCCLTLSAGTSFAFTLTERPAYNDYTNAVSMGTWCGKAVEERGVVVGDTNAFLPKASSQQGIVINVKQNIQSRYPSYIKPGIADVPGVLNTFGVDGLKWSNDVAFLTYCERATNCFISTPYSPIQNSSVTGDWQNVKVMITNLTHTIGYTSILQTNYYMGHSDYPPTNVWSAAKSVAESTWQEHPLEWGLIGVWSEGYYYYDSDLEDDWYIANLINLSCKIGFCNSVTSFEKSSHVYANCGALNSVWWSAFGEDLDLMNITTVFDPQGASISSSSGWSLAGTIPDNNLERSDGVILGNDIFTSSPAMPSWCAEPYGTAWINGGYDITAKGWQYYDSVVIHNWTSSPNGFQYK